MNLQGMTLHERAAQLMFPRLGSNMPPPVRVSEDLDRFEKLLDACPVGGLILFNGAHPSTREALSRLQRNSRVPLLVASDIERGVGQQIRGATVFPHARAYAAAGSEELLESSARAQAREALASGIHITCSPVADVNRDPRNPIIATRAFGADPHEAARYVRAFIRGTRAEGLLTTAKHFPGHGNTSQDSHSEIPVVRADRDEMEAFDLLPFRAAIDEGVDLVMTAHVIYPALDPERPATLSPAILRDLLRDEMSFRGATITDSLLMGAIRNSHPDAGSQAAALVAAGVDILLDVPDPIAAVDGIVNAVDEGVLEEEIVDAAVARVLGLKKRLIDRFGGDIFGAPETLFDADPIGAASTRDLAHRVAYSALDVVGGSGGVLPLKEKGEDILGVLIKPHTTRLDPEEEPFGEAFRRAFPGARYRQVGPEATEAELGDIRSLAESSRIVVLALVVKPAAWHAFGLLPEQHHLAAELVARHRTIVVALGSPVVLDDYPAAALRLCAYSDVEVSQEAVVAFLRGT